MSERKQKAWVQWMKDPSRTSLRSEYHQLKVQSRKVADAAREAWRGMKAEEAERRYELAVREGRGGSMLKDLRLLQSGQRLRVSTALLAEDGKTKLTGVSEKLERWGEHCEQVCNISSQVVERTLEDIPPVPLQAVPAVSDEHISMAPTEGEIRDAVRQLKKGRAPGEDMISAELLKLGEETVVKGLNKLAGRVWNTEVVPLDWVKQLMIPLHKKVAFDKCYNFRGIALLGVPEKVFRKVLRRRLAERAELLLRENSCGFRSGRGCVDQVFTLRVLVEKAREFNTPVYLCFVDLKKAYDSVNREALWSVLRRTYHLLDKLLRILQALHRGTRGAVRACGKLSSKFSISNGVRQGDIMLAPTLFNLFLDAVLCKALEDHPGCGLRILYNQEAELVGSRRKMSNQLLLQDIEYAYDMALIADSMDALESFLRAVDASCTETGLTISVEKKKILAINPSEMPSQQPRNVLLRPGGGVVLVVENFEYHGSTITEDCSLDRESSVQIARASRAFESLHKVLWRQRGVKVKTKMRIFKSVALFTLLCGCETWAPIATHIKRLQAFMMKCIRESLCGTRGEIQS